MEPMSIFREFAQTAGPAAVTALWQGAVLALGLTVCLQVARGMSAADRFRAWAAGFVALLSLPLLPFLTGPSAEAHGTTSGVAARAWFELDQSWALAIAGLWIAASVWRAADLAVHAFKLRKMWQDAEPIGIRVADAEVCATQHLDRPSVIGFFRPRILIPAWLLERLTPSELEQVMLHEAEHLRRRDDWTNLLQKIALVVFPLNPALVWMERRLCHEREMACDDAVVRATGKPRAYAACLTSLAERGLQRRREALSLGAWRQRPELVGRVHRLLKQGPGLRPASARALMAVVGMGLIFGSVEFARAPQLVAFVAPVIAQSNTPDLVHSDGRAMVGFRAVNAVAHISSAPPEMAASKQRTARAANDKKAGGKSGYSHCATDAGLESAPEFIEIAAAESRSSANKSSNWVVLTTWEQVVPVHRKAEVVADYNVETAAPAESAGQAATGAAVGAPQGAAPAAVHSWVVTELILRVDPSRSDFSDSSRGDGARDTNTQPGQPTVVPPQPAVIPLPTADLPLQDGWLVLQL